MVHLRVHIFRVKTENGDQNDIKINDSVYHSLKIHQMVHNYRVKSENGDQNDIKTNDSMYHSLKNPPNGTHFSGKIRKW